MSSSLAAHLFAERNRRFVGRTQELELFQRAIASPKLPFHVLHIFGAGGVGKTTLMQQFARICEKLQVRTIHIESRNLEPTPVAFINTFCSLMGLQETDFSQQVQATIPERCVILIDTYEHLISLDEWLREEFLPQLSDNTLIVFAGRNPPSSAWRSDPGWQALIHILSLCNFTPKESFCYLRKRDIPASEHSSILDFTHGHPLALSLIADTFAQKPEISLRAEFAPDVVKTLLERFIQEIPTQAYRMALQACAVVRITTETLLTQMLDVPDSHELFEWLRKLSFIESGQLGLFPHDLVRQVLIADLRWRNPDFYAELHHRARSYYSKRMQQTQGQQKHRVLFDYVFLHRDNPAIRPCFIWGEHSGLVADSLRETDQTALLSMVAKYEGQESAKIAAHWLMRQPHNGVVFRDSHPLPAGFAIWVELHKTSQEDLNIDPGAMAAWQYLQNVAPLRPQEGATIFRFWMVRDTYQAVSPTQSLIFINFIQYFQKTPGLAYTFLPCAEPDAWAAMLTYSDMIRIPAADFEVEGRCYGVYGHDWRIVTPAAWQQLLAQKEIAASLESTSSNLVSQPLLVLSQTDFMKAVQDALRNFTRPDALEKNPLLRSRSVCEALSPVEKQVVIPASMSDDVVALQTLVKQAAESLQLFPRDQKLYRAVYRTYLNPAPTQEQAAELLDLPFSTYRRHLKAGIRRIVEILWQKEISYSYSSQQ